MHPIEHKTPAAPVNLMALLGQNPGALQARLRGQTRLPV